MSLDAHEMNIQTVRSLNEGLRVGPVVIVVNAQCRGVVLPPGRESPAVFKLLPGKVTFVEGAVKFETLVDSTGGCSLRYVQCHIPFGAIVTVRAEGTPEPSAETAPMRTRGHLRLIQGGRS